MQFGFATSECYWVELDANSLWLGNIHVGAAGGEFASCRISGLIRTHTDEQKE